ncbi:MAG: rod shape-determining protein MreC, partial [Caulobacteraceae bacterium]|nr:rod shape-determining protein MreC [Caulobacteraceae bacterium]
MSLRDGPLSDIKPPLTWLAVAALALALIGSLALFIGDRRVDAHAGVSAVRRDADSGLGTVAGVLSAPLHWLGGLEGAAQDYVLAGTQNHQLKRDLAAARTWRDQVYRLRDENARLSALLGIRTDPPIPMVSARTVLDARGPFANTRIADVGAARGVIEGNPALSEHGLVGRVIGVARDVSRIMLLTDVESRTPVLIARTNGRAILAGDGGANPKLDYLRTHDPLREGDRILTSGDGGVLPRGLPVGVAVKAYDGGWRVALDSDSSPIDFVQILLFKDFSQLAPPQALAPSVLPPTATG